ncbi:helix-turn-helix domain-containing protein [Belliella marina]|uniref:Helix-turn-helix domain-containing protein n=1 Tax=Belliella marina TaxID=1644146 RepID=A0ABW4VK14_9BACT
MFKAQKIMRILRESRDFSQEYVANVLDVNQKTYSNLESGKTKLTLERIQQLAEFYHVKPDYFLSEDLPIINYNTGEYSRSIISPNKYQEAKENFSEFYERIIKEKDIHIAYLIKELESLKKDKEELYSMIHNMNNSKKPSQ